VLVLEAEESQMRATISRNAIWFLAAALLFCPRTQAQTPAATAVEQQEMLAKIVAQSSQLKTLTCSFEQIKHLAMLQDKMVSQGLLYYRSDSKVRWEYQSPYTYIFILNGKQMLMQADTNKNVVDAKSSKLFQAIIKIMTSCISGEGLTDTKNFQTTLYHSETRLEAVLKPQQRELRKMFATIKFTFNVHDYSVDMVELNEVSGDATSIRFFNKTINESISDAIFGFD